MNWRQSLELLLSKPSSFPKPHEFLSEMKWADICSCKDCCGTTCKRVLSKQSSKV